MEEISNQALKVANNTEFPNNNAGAITPSRLRGFNTDMIDSLVDEISYTADSASWEQSIAALEAFTGSATGLTTGSLLITASANLNTITFTKGNGSTFNVLVNTGSADLTDLGPLNAFTASVAGTNAFTQSANLRLNSLEATTASLNTSVSNLNTFTQSIQIEVNGLEAKTGSYATTGSNIFVGNQTIVGSVSASSFVSASRFIGDGSQITGITASVATTILDDGILQGTATSLNFTGSGITATVVAGVAIIEASIDQSTLGRYTLTSSFNSYTQSTDAKINSINGFTASVAGTNTFTASIAGTNTFTASLAATNAFTASIAGTNTFTASIAGTNAFTQSANARLNSIEAQSGSWVTAAITASSLTTASFSGNTLSFTKGDGSTFGVVIPDVSGSATLPAGVVSGSAQILNYGIFATTGSNTFIGNQTLTGSLFISGNINMVNGADLVTHHVRAQGSNGLELQTAAGAIIVSMGGGGGTQAGFVGAVTANSISASTFTGLGNLSLYSQSVDSRINALEAFTASIAGINAFTQSIQAEVDDIQAKTGSFATTGSNTFTGNQTITSTNITDLTIQSTGGALQSNLVLDSSVNNIIGKGALAINNNGQFGGSGSIKIISTLNTIDLASDSGVRVGPTNGSGNNIIAQPISFQAHSGSLSLAPSGFTNTTASLSHISSSSGTNFVNLMFKNNSNTATTVISGSNNIFTNPTAPTAGFIRHIGGSNNLMLNSGSVPQISGSMLTAPSFMGNIISHTSTNAITLRGPVSASAYSINANILMGGQITYGTSAANSFDKATAGMSTLGNALFNGNINVNAATTPLSASVTVAGNLVFGAQVTLNCFSSSVTYASNVQNGGITVNNSFVPASGSSASVLPARIAVNTIYGIGHALNVSGTNTSTTQGKQFYANLLAGTFISSSMPTGDNCNILATAVIGNSLIITGSTLTSTFAGADTANSGQGSLFAGRFNSIDGTKDLTAETVFAIGTGTSNTDRKTGFLIDSGSNTFVEGTLNVSGSTSITGSLTLSSSLDIELNVIGNVAITGAMNFLSGSASGSVVTNVGDTFTGTAAVTKIISLSSAEYSALSPKDPNTLYIIV